MFLMLHGYLHPGYDFLLRRKLPSIWRETPRSPMHADLERFLAAAAEWRFTHRTRPAVASQVTARLLIQTGSPLAELTETDLGELVEACKDREQTDGVGWHHDSGAVQIARVVLYHLEVLTDAPVNPAVAFRQSFEQRMRDVPEHLRASFVAYLERWTATHTRRTVTGTATRLAHFGRHLAAVGPELRSLAELDRRRHIETYLTAVAEARSSRHGEPISASERRAPSAGAWGQRATQQHPRMGLARSARPPAGVPVRHPQAAPPAPALPGS